MSITRQEAAALMARVQRGDEQAWAALVDAYSGLVWSIARSHRLGPDDAADVSQATWLRLVENLHRIDDPARVGTWLATTARRECLRVLRLQARQVLVEPEVLDLRDPDQVPVDRHPGADTAGEATVRLSPRPRSQEPPLSTAVHRRFGGSER